MVHEKDVEFENRYKHFENKTESYPYILSLGQTVYMTSKTSDTLTLHFFLNGIAFYFGCACFIYVGCVVTSLSITTGNIL